ncbi:MAG: xylulokinase [Deinococcales bacterium]
MLLGLDLGTGSCKALLLESNGTVVGEASRHYAVQAPQAGWAETNPLEWWKAIQEATREAVGEFAAEVRAIGLSGQMHGVVLTDAAGAPIKNAILWSDTRSRTVLGQFTKLQKQQLERLNNPIVAGMLGSTLLWLRQEGQLKEATYAFLPKDWLRLQLTAQVATDPSDASATLLYDLLQDDWAWDVLETLGLPPLLPPLLASDAIAGTLTLGAAAALGLKPGIPVATGGGDTPCAMLGNGILEPNTAQLSVGTGGQIVLPQHHTQHSPSTHCYRTTLLETKYYVMSAMQNAGLALERVRGWLGVEWRQFHNLAFSVSDTQGLIFLPYLSGERTPHLSALLRGAFLNLSLQHTQAHLARAALLGVALSLKDGLDVLSNIHTLRLVGGGSLEPRWRQLLCDVLGVPLFSSGVANASARGAALLAGLATKTYQNALETVHHLPEPQMVATPERDYTEARAQFRAALGRSLP